MQFDPPLVQGRLKRRYKRFLADVVLADGSEITAHCPNTGAMLGCQEPDSAVWLSRSDNPKRKYAHTWELVETYPGVIVGINTVRTNSLVFEALAAGRLSDLSGYEQVEREVTVGDGSSRIDFRLTGREQDCYVEVKNVTAALTEGIALFPDAVSTRATRHLNELMALKREGHRAVLCFCVQREDVGEVRPADGIDPVYGRSLREAAAAGVEIVAWGALVGPHRVEVVNRLAVNLDAPR